MNDVTPNQLQSFNMEIIYKTIFELAPDAVIIINNLGEIIMCNDRTEKLFGYRKEELTGKEIELLIPEGHVRRHKDHRDSYFKDPHIREMGTGMELLAKKKDGSEFSVEISLSPVHFNNSLFISAAIRDVSEKRHLLIQLKQQKSQLAEQNKRLINFAYVVSHNLRSHSGNLSTMLNFFESASTEDEKQQVWQHIVKISAGLSATIGNLSEIVSLQSHDKIKRETINLSKYIDETLETLSADIAMHNGTIINKVFPDITLVHNPAYIESILLNFISNTIKYRQPDRKLVCTLNAYYEGERLVFEVADNGLGIDLSVHGDQLFGMFKTFHGNKDAHGIGLYIAKSQIEAFGGKVEVQSKVNEGTTFKIFLS